MDEDISRGSRKVVLCGYLNAVGNFRLCGIVLFNARR
jgi:hypothetical protein